jgi:general secretion pathway protein A
VRLLANIETATEKLLPLVLAGQPELRDRLNDPSLRQLKQRVALRCELPPLSVSETAGYIASRVRTAGGDASRAFTREAVILIHEYSRGIPRTISVMCDNALMSGFALGRQPVDRAIILEVSHDFDLEKDENRSAGESANRDGVPTDPPASSLNAAFGDRRGGDSAQIIPGRAASFGRTSGF